MGQQHFELRKLENEIPSFVITMRMGALWYRLAMGLILVQTVLGDVSRTDDDGVVWSHIDR